MLSSKYINNQGGPLIVGILSRIKLWFVGDELSKPSLPEKPKAMNYEPAKKSELIKPTAKAAVKKTTTKVATTAKKATKAAPKNAAAKAPAKKPVAKKATTKTPAKTTKKAASKKA